MFTIIVANNQINGSEHKYQQRSQLGPKHDLVPACSRYTLSLHQFSRIMIPISQELKLFLLSFWALPTKARILCLDSL